jgi:acetolactate synthase I/II/III large subunit
MAFRMNGAHSLLATLTANGVGVCFANPGTSEMHVVAAVDQVAGMRCVLGLFEGVVTGAADGYARMADRPVGNVIGDHATYHRQYDAPLTSDEAAPHDWILPTGGAIGSALPCAAGAAIASPGRRVVVLESNGSGMYMPQARDGAGIVG